MPWDDACFYVGAELEEPHVWATLDELNVTPPPGRASPPTLRAEEKGYEVIIECRIGGGKTQRLHIRQDSRLWTE